MPFEVVNQNSYILIHLKGECGAATTDTGLLDRFQLLMQESQLKYVIFQCSECSSISSGILREIAGVHKSVKSVNGGVRLVSANKVILDFIKNQGLDRLLVNKLSLRGALVDFGLAKSKDFDANFINPFLNATRKVFKVQCFMEITPGKPFLKKETDPLLMGDVSGIISINSETFNGTLAISIMEPIFNKIASNMLGEEIKTIEEKYVDLVGELANMILGQAKLELMSLGYSIQSALPSCVWGKDHKVKHFGSGQCIVLPFITEAGTLYSEIMTSNSVAGLAAPSKQSQQKVS
ncbi:MAG: chemotaxis protein CheX [Bacteriovoracaceae bacterium]|nr:chemotaxis protein CheX [Bacteriovoracaceae bacterium]